MMWFWSRNPPQVFTFVCCTDWNVCVVAVARAHYAYYYCSLGALRNVCLQFSHWIIYITWSFVNECPSNEFHFFLYCCQLSLILFRDIILLSHGVTLSIFRQRWVFIFQWQSEKAQETQWIFTMIWNFHQSNLRVCEFVLLSLPHNRTVLSKQQIVLIFRFRLSKCTHTHNHEYPINFVRQSTEW